MPATSGLKNHTTKPLRPQPEGAPPRWWPNVSCTWRFLGTAYRLVCDAMIWEFSKKSGERKANLDSLVANCCFFSVKLILFESCPQEVQRPNLFGLGLPGCHLEKISNKIVMFPPPYWWNSSQNFPSKSAVASDPWQKQRLHNPEFIYYESQQCSSSFAHTHYIIWKKDRTKTPKESLWSFWIGWCDRWWNWNSLYRCVCFS